MTILELPVLEIVPDFAESPRLAGRMSASLVSLSDAPRVNAFVGRKPNHVLSHKFVFHTRATAEEFEDFFNDVAGSWGDFWVPSWHGELNPVADVSSGATSLSITPVNYATVYDPTTDTLNDLGHYIFFLHYDGTLEIKRVLSVSGTSPEVLTLESGVSREYLVGEFIVGFLYCVRFASDELVLDFQNTSFAECSISMIESQEVTLEEAVEPLVCIDPPFARQSIAASILNSDPASTFDAACFAKTYTFNGTAGQVLNLYMHSAAFTARLTLTLPDTSVLEADDTNAVYELAETNAAGLTLTLPANGIYTIEASTVEAAAEGAFKLVISSGVAQTVDLSGLGDGNFWLIVRSAADLLFIADLNGPTIVTVDPDTGTIVNSVTVGGGAVDTEALFYGSTDDKVYALVSVTGGLKIQEINATTGALISTPYAVTGVDSDFGRMAFDSQRNRAIVIGNEGRTTDDYAIVDLATRTIIQSGTVDLVLGTPWDVIYCTATDRYYITFLDNDGLLKMHPTTYVTTASTFTARRGRGIWYVPELGRIISTNTSDRLVVLNPSADTVLAQINISEIEGVAYDRCTEEIKVLSFSFGLASLNGTTYAITNNQFTMEPFNFASNEGAAWAVINSKTYVIDGSTQSLFAMP